MRNAIKNKILLTYSVFKAFYLKNSCISWYNTIKLKIFEIACFRVVLKAIYVENSCIHWEHTKKINFILK